MPDIDLTLDTFDVPLAVRPSDAFTGAKYDYVLRRLTKASGPVLVELHAHLYPDAPPQIDPEQAQAVGRWREGYFRLFLSHTNEHKVLAAGIKTVLEDFGVDVFVAHAMIEPTKKWQDEIESALGTCDALAALWTPDFVSSRWCDQEVGFALGRGRLILAVKQGVDPHGFIGKYQAVPGDTSGIGSARTIARGIFDGLWNSDMTRRQMARIAAIAYAKSFSFDEARENFRRIKQLMADEWTDEMVEMVETAGRENRQLEEGVCLDAGPDHGKAIPELLSLHLDQLLERVPPSRSFEPTAAGADDDIPF